MYWHKPFLWMESDGPWLLEVVFNQHRRHPALQVGHGDGVGAGVGPVEVGVDPVHGQTVGGEDGAAVNGFPPPTLIWVHQEMHKFLDVKRFYSFDGLFLSSFCHSIYDIFCLSLF